MEDPKKKSELHLIRDSLSSDQTNSMLAASSTTKYGLPNNSSSTTNTLNNQTYSYSTYPLNRRSPFTPQLSQLDSTNDSPALATPPNVTNHLVPPYTLTYHVGESPRYSLTKSVSDNRLNDSVAVVYKDERLKFIEEMGATNYSIGVSYIHHSRPVSPKNSPPVTPNIKLSSKLSKLNINISNLNNRDERRTETLNKDEPPTISIVDVLPENSNDINNQQSGIDENEGRFLGLLKRRWNHVPTTGKRFIYGIVCFPIWWTTIFTNNNNLGRHAFQFKRYIWAMVLYTALILLITIILASFWGGKVD